MKSLRRPTKEELLAAVGARMPDVIAPGLKVLFCGINPSVYSAVVRHHFARPGNRFWPALYASGFTPRLLAPHEQGELLALGHGITNVVEHASVSADSLTAEQYAEGARRLEARVRRYQPRYLAVLGIGAWRTAFGKPRAVLGPQPELLGGDLRRSPTSNDVEHHGGADSCRDRGNLLDGLGCRDEDHVGARRLARRPA